VLREIDFLLNKCLYRGFDCVAEAISSPTNSSHFLTSQQMSAA